MPMKSHATQSGSVRIQPFEVILRRKEAPDLSCYQAQQMQNFCFQHAVAIVAQVVKFNSRWDSSLSKTSAISN